MIIGEITVKIGIIEPGVRALELPLLVRSGSLLFFFCLKFGLGVGLHCVHHPLSLRGNFGRLLARFNYSSPYGMPGD